MKICENCGTIAEFTIGECKNCNKSQIVDLGYSTSEWFKLSASEKENVIKNTLSLTDETYELIQDMWETNKIKTNEVYEPINAYKQQNKPKCPYCNSTNLSKISTMSRAVSVGIFGLASSKVGKQWHCNNCKSDF